MDGQADAFYLYALIVLNFLLFGPITVAIPVLADQSLPERATAFGLSMSTFARGNLLGYIIAGSLPRPDGAKLRLLIIAMFAGFGIVIGSFGIITSTWVDVALLFVLSMGNSFIVVPLMTWMQTRTLQQMLGRLMALLMFYGTGLAPIAQAISGVLSKWNLTMLFVILGVLALLLTIWMAFHPDLKSFSDSLSATQAEGRVGLEQG